MMNDDKRAEAKILCRRIMLYGAATTHDDAKKLYDIIESIPTIHGELPNLTDRPNARQ